MCQQMQHRSRAADEYIVKKQYLPGFYAMDSDAAGISSKPTNHSHNYNSEKRQTQVQSHLSYNPIHPVPKNNLHPNYQKQFFDTEVGKGPKQQELLQPRRPFNVQDNVDIQYDEKSVNQSKQALQNQIHSQNKPEHHVTDQTFEKPQQLKTDFYNPSIRSHNVFGMPGVNNEQNYKRKSYSLNNDVIDKSRLETSKIMLKNAEKYFD